MGGAIKWVIKTTRYHGCDAIMHFPLPEVCTFIKNAMRIIPPMWYRLPEFGPLAHGLKRTVPFKTFLVPVPFPLVTTFETAGTYKKWLWPNSAYITYTWHATNMTYVPPYIYIYIRTAPARICTPLIVSRSLRSLANDWEVISLQIYCYNVLELYLNYNILER